MDIENPKPRLQPHYKTRINVLGCLVVLASWDVPKRLPSGEWFAEWIEDPEYGGWTVGFIDWSAVSFVTWQFVS